MRLGCQTIASAERRQRRILNSDGNVIAKLCTPYTISVKGIICV